MIRTVLSELVMDALRSEVGVRFDHDFGGKFSKCCASYEMTESCCEMISVASV